MKLIKGLLTTLLTLIAIVSVSVIGVYIYVRVQYNIDLFNTVIQLKTLSEKVDEDALCPNKFDLENDMVDVQVVVNKSVDDMITYTEEHGYSVNFDKLPDEMKNIISLSDKQVGALAQTIIEQEIGGEIEIGNTFFGVDLLQVDFANIGEKSADFNAIVRLDITEAKSQIPTGFPFNFLSKYIPDFFYISSTVKVNHLEEAFRYELAPVSFTINNLDHKNTEDLFRTVDLILKTGSSDKLNLMIADMFISSLIGSEETNGLAYSLKEIGGKDYLFQTVGDSDFFTVLRDETFTPAL